MCEYLYDELGEKEIDKRKRYHIPIYLSPDGISITLYHPLPFNNKEWRQLNKTIEAINNITTEPTSNESSEGEG